MLDRADATAERDPDRDRHLQVSVRSVVHLGNLADDLVEAGVDEAVELDLAHRPVPADGQPDRRADDAGLGKRGVEHPRFAEVLLQTVRDAEDAAELADVLAHDDDLGVLLQRLAQAVVERLGHRYRSHAPTSSNDERYVANP